MLIHHVLQTWQDLRNVAFDVGRNVSHQQWEQEIFKFFRFNNKSQTSTHIWLFCLSRAKFKNSLELPFLSSIRWNGRRYETQHIIFVAYIEFYAPFFILLYLTEIKLATMNEGAFSLWLNFVFDQVFNTAIFTNEKSLLKSELCTRWLAIHFTPLKSESEKAENAHHTFI